MPCAMRSGTPYAKRSRTSATSSPKPKRSGSGPFSGARGLAAGAGLAAAAPLAKKGVDAVRANGGIPTPSPTKAAGRMASKAGDKVGSRPEGHGQQQGR